MENTPKPPNPLDKARAIIDEKRKLALQQEEVEQESQGLDMLFETYSQLLNEYKEKKESVSRLSNEVADTNKTKKNLFTTQKQAWETLENNPETSELFKKDTEGDMDLRENRQEIFGAVFKDSQDEKRELKKEIRAEKTSLSQENKNINTLLIKINEIKDNPDWNKLIEKKKEDFLSAKRANEDFYRFNGEKIRSAREIKKIQEFIGENSEDIETLEQKLIKGFEELIQKTQAVFENAQKSEEYRPKDFGEVDFNRYKSLLPTEIEDVRFSVYSYDSESLKLPQFDHNSPCYTAIMKDMNTIENEILQKGREIQEATGFFSGRKSLEKQKANLQSKRNFLYKISQSVWEHQRQLNSITSSELQTETRKHFKNSIGYAVGRFIQGIGSYELEKTQKGYPEFNKETTVRDLFRWKNIEEVLGDTLVDYREKDEEWDKMQDFEKTKRKEYDLVAGEGSSQRLY